ncbi:MAG: hypothetical protein AVDCRST_MAG27-2545, partial [uncultured Craurococcus sp.]
AADRPGRGPGSPQFPHGVVARCGHRLRAARPAYQRGGGRDRRLPAAARRRRGGLGGGAPRAAGGGRGGRV